MDDIKVKKLLVVLDKLHLNLDMNSYDFRLRLQKIIYLIQDYFKLDLGFNYSWYLRGPYSSQLADAAYGIKEYNDDQKRNIITSLELSRNIEEKITQSSTKLAPYLEQAHWLELAASIQFLKSSFSNNLSKETLKTMLLEKKPNMKQMMFGENNFNTAFEEVITFLS